MRFCLLLALCTAATAGTITVLGTTEPWDPTLAGNSAYPFDNAAATAPAVVTSGITPGADVSITFVGGLDYTDIIYCCVDGLGYDGTVLSEPVVRLDQSDLPNNAPGAWISGTVWSLEVLGTFTDSLGDIVGTPFVVGDGTTVVVPTGATQLQLGVNDNVYSDNSGNSDALTFNVTSNGTVSSVPEPSTFALVGGAALLGLVVRRRKRVSA
jgi:hypothetical protein